MSISNFFDHKCNIYHQDNAVKTVGYGLTGQSVDNYPASPDVSNVSCHFSVNDENIKTSQESPQRIADISDTIALPPGTDIKFNDKIEDLTHGTQYTVIKPPRNIRGNHIKAKLFMLEIQKDL